MLANQSSESISFASAGKGSAGGFGQRRLAFFDEVWAASTFHVEGCLVGIKYSSLETDGVKSPMGMAVVKNEITTPTLLVTISL